MKDAVKFVYTVGRCGVGTLLVHQSHICNTKRKQKERDQTAAARAATKSGQREVLVAKRDRASISDGKRVGL